MWGWNCWFWPWSTRVSIMHIEPVMQYPCGIWHIKPQIKFWRMLIYNQPRRETFNIHLVGIIYMWNESELSWVELSWVFSLVRFGAKILHVASQNGNATGTTTPKLNIQYTPLHPYSTHETVILSPTYTQQQFIRLFVYVQFHGFLPAIARLYCLPVNTRRLGCTLHDIEHSTLTIELPPYNLSFS